MNAPQNQLSFPKIKRITIDHFSLYRLVDKVQVDIEEGILCLAGANGLGKSTFISILHFALTGVVVNPKKVFASINQISKYYNENKGFADSYFDGRISEADREQASVTIEFVLNDNQYTIKRNFFETDELNEFLIKNGSGSTLYDTASMLPREKNESYQKQITSDLKLESFDQFAFLFYFLFTFDESRKLLFWDARTLSRILHLVFGTDAAKAERSDFLKKEIARHESNMRNIQNSIQKDEAALADLIKKHESTGETPEGVGEIIERHDELSIKLSEKLEQVELQDKELKSCSLKIADYSLKLTLLKKTYDDLFEERFKTQSVENDQRVIQILKELSAALHQGEDGEREIKILKEIISEINVKIYNPLVSGIDELKNIDASITQLKNELGEATTRKLRVEDSKNKLNKELLELQENIQKIEADFKDVLSKYAKPKETQSIDNIIKSYQEVIDSRKQSKAREEENRNSYQAELSDIEKELGLKYAEVEKDFIPIFSSYANNFLGLEVNVNSKKTNEGFSLGLSVNNNGRVENYQLSESQRYFIDIALRMALIQYKYRKGTIMIDTPEGSLDIAYESKAGKMFAGFALSGYDIIMTANINTSQLLVQMAKVCRRDKMRLERMTSWTTLSQVQQDEKDKINSAFENIEETLMA